MWENAADGKPTNEKVEDRLEKERDECKKMINNSARHERAGLHICKQPRLLAGTACSQKCYYLWISNGLNGWSAIFYAVWKKIVLQVIEMERAVHSNSKWYMTMLSCLFVHILSLIVTWRFSITVTRKAVHANSCKFLFYFFGKVGVTPSCQASASHSMSMWWAKERTG